MGAAAGIIWLMNGSFDTIAMAINNMIGDVSGIICDGASGSCAMKVTSISSAWKAILLALDNSVVSGNDGIVDRDVENSIANLCAIAGRAVQHTDRQIIEIMAHKRYQAVSAGNEDITWGEEFYTDVIYRGAFSGAITLGATRC